MDHVNHTGIQNFILAGFTTSGTLRPLAFLGTLCVYLLTLAGNLFIIVLVRADSGLSTPMYFFVSVLSFLELWYVSTTVPTLLHTLLHGHSPIPSAVCFVQLYVFHSLGMTECYLLGVMALDRYLAICRPLHYHALMSRQVQLWLAGATWVAGFSAALVPASLTATLPFCLTEVAHYFCDLGPLMRLACVDTGWNVQVHIVVIGIINACNLVLILGLYGGILRAVLKLPSAASRAKAFSTCSSHVTVVALFFGSAFIVYVGPPESRPEGADKLIALVYTFLTPFLNPIIYTLRNKEPPMDTHNHSSLAEFVLLGFPSVGRARGWLLVLLLLAYLFTVCGNMLIFLVIRLDAALHTPMYRFVSILSFLELWYTATTIPKMLANLLSDKKTISFSGCLLQTYFFHSLGASECYLLTAMAYDRYLAICRPLHYPAIMTPMLCARMAAGCWTCGFLCPISEVILVSQLPFCGYNEIQHIFCDFPPLLSLACKDTSTNVLVDFAINAFIILVTFLFIMVSYGRIIGAVLKIKTTAGRKKAFSTCASHLTVVLIFFGSIIFMYVRLKKSYSLNLDRTLAVVYSVLTPLVNPVIYSLRNKELIKAIKRTIFRKGERASSTHH
ncbi:Olfactory receptor 6N2 [Camelus dromedarius]|uniref:Olfactory receptor 6N2 n=2 Tax=Camelus dromedarius TaxID=9838 RepID=A0A5N4CNW9_CAMDR|nr:Olfactory receptor 6N2 [Camelus dromedarius]